MRTLNMIRTAWIDSDQTSRKAKIVFHLAIFLTAFILLFSRRPDAVLSPQFYAEDGTFWYADAYNHSWRCLFMAEAGYLHTVPRLIALFTLLFPFALVPAVMNAFAFFFQILPIHLFLSSRFSTVSTNIRLLGCFLYIALPNSFEIHANATNIQWHLALLACMVILARQASTAPWRFFDFALLVLASLDSPLGIPLIFIAGIKMWMRKENQAKWQLLALVPGTVIEIAFVLFSQTRRAASNGATLTRLGSILGGQVFLSSVLGIRTFIQFYFGHFRHLLFIQIIAALIGLAVVIYALRFAPLELRLFVLFSATVLAMALQHPLASMQVVPDQWELLRIPGIGNRYYFFPMMAFFCCLIWMTVKAPLQSKFPRYAALTLLVLTPVGICRDWKYKPFADFHFSNYVAEFERAAPGTKIVIPTNPTWKPWSMELIKR